MISDIKEYLYLTDSDSKSDNNRIINEELSSDLISEIIKNYPERKSWIIHNKLIPIKILEELATDDNDDVRFTIAMKKKCNRVTFEKLLKDKNYSVRLAVVRNKKLPIDLLEIIANDTNDEIQEDAKKILEMRNNHLSKQEINI